MSIRKISQTLFEVSTPDMVMLYSYNIPVAVYISSVSELNIPEGFYKSTEKYSEISSNHIDEWFRGEYKEKDQSWFDELSQRCCGR